MRRRYLWALLPLLALPAMFYPLGAGVLVDGKQLFEDVRTRVEGGAVDSLSSDEVWIRAARGLVQQIDDPYAELFSPEQMASFTRNTLRNDYVPTIRRILDQMPQAGVDIITANCEYAGSQWEINFAPGRGLAGPDNAFTLGMPVTELLSGWGGWPGLRVRVTARWGWPVVPRDVSMATLLLANRLYLRKDSPEGVAGSSEWGAVRLSRWDPDVEALISPYIMPGFA